MATDTERVLVIRGASEDVQLAEILVQQTLANQPRLETLELKVPPHCGGWIIGRDGENIRSMQEKSRCKINVERDTGSGEPQACSVNALTCLSSTHLRQMVFAQLDSAAPRTKSESPGN